MEDESNSKPQNEGQTPETFTQDQVNEIVSKRIAEVNAKADKKLKDEVSRAIAETERQSKLSQSEREKELKEKQEAQLADRERAVSLRERRADAKEELAKRNIDIGLVDFVVDVDEEKTADNIDRLTQAFNNAVSSAVKARLAGSAPEDLANTEQKQATKRPGGLTAF